MAAPIRVAILDDYQSVSQKFADWSSLQYRVTIDTFTKPIQESQDASQEDAVIRRLQSYNIICAMRERTRFPARVLNALPNLKLIATTGNRNAAIDLKKAKERGVVVSGTGGAGASTLEHIWALILATVRNVAQDHARVASGHPKWQVTIPAGLHGKTLGLIGVGRLGTQTAQIAKAFNMKVIGWSPNLTPERAAQSGVEFCSTKAELLKTCDVVSIHMVLAPNTIHIVNGADLALMKSTAFLINTSRGPHVEETALVDALNNGVIAGAGLDVFDIEPLPLEHPLRKAKNVTLTPHVGYVSDTMYEVFWQNTVENISSFLDGKPLRVMQDK